VLSFPLSFFVSVEVLFLRLFIGNVGQHCGEKKREAGWVKSSHSFSLRDIAKRIFGKNLATEGKIAKKYAACFWFVGFGFALL